MKKEKRKKKELVLKICYISKKKIGLNYDLSKPEGRFVKNSNSYLLKKITEIYKPEILLNRV